MDHFWGPSLINWTTWYSRSGQKFWRQQKKTHKESCFLFFNDWSFLEFLPNLTFLWSNISIEVLVRYLAQGVCFHFFPTLWKSPLPAALFCVRFSRWWCRIIQYLISNSSTRFENHRKSLIQHCERSELRLHFEWTKVS